ncbi:hypothetical protein CONLIGDRAFT_629887, partial [Coniochaeta ligniaria NRRL 30616]
MPSCWDDFLPNMGITASEIALLAHLPPWTPPSPTPTKRKSPAQTEPDHDQQSPNKRQKSEYSPDFTPAPRASLDCQPSDDGFVSPDFTPPPHHPQPTDDDFVSPDFTPPLPLVYNGPFVSRPAPRAYSEESETDSVAIKLEEADEDL